MKFSYRLLGVTFLLSTFSSVLQGQDTTSVLMHSPSEWRYERIDFPLSFAPDLDFEGFEELRFAPGMFDTLAMDYFTYLFGISLQGTHEFTISRLTHFLKAYYSGLYEAVSRSRDMTIVENAVTVDVKAVEGKESTFDALIKFPDAFTNGKTVRLNLYIPIVLSPAGDKTLIYAMGTPRSRDSETWKHLGELLDQNMSYSN